MAAQNVNRPSRKRKSDIDLVFEVNDTDCSPSNSPEPVQPFICNKSSPEIDFTADVQFETSNLQDALCSGTENTQETVNPIVSAEEDNSKPDAEEDGEIVSVKNEMTSSLKKILFSVKFCDAEFAKQYNDLIVTAVMGLFDYKLKSALDEGNLEIKFWAEPGESDMDVVDEESNESVYSDVKPSPRVQSPEIDSFFVVDTTPGSNQFISKEPKFLPNFKYDAIEQEGDNEPKKDTNQCIRQANCFNCNGLHSLKDCEEPKDYKRIQVARNQFKNAYKSMRYHLDEEQKYGHYVPGKISEKLRIALNIGKHDIPNHVYHMRRVGYSPGWLEMAKVTSSNIALIDFHGSAETNAVQETINPDKIVEYPGFNMPMEKGCKDNYAERRCPAYNNNHSKAAMLAHINQMNLAASVEKVPEPTKTIKTEVPLPLKCDSDSNSHDRTEKYSDNKCRGNSPSLTDLEKKKKEILDMLNAQQTPKIKEEPDKSFNDSLTNSIKSSSYGTPILKNCSPYEMLPQSEKFSKDISQVINFENLPNSTGKYEQINKVMTKVRKMIRYSNESKTNT